MTASAAFLRLFAAFVLWVCLGACTQAQPQLRPAAAGRCPQASRVGSTRKAVGAACASAQRRRWGA